MFQQAERFSTLLLQCQHCVKHAYNFDDLLENIISLELLVRTEAQTVELELLIEQAEDAFGFCIEDELEYLRG